MTKQTQALKKQAAGNAQAEAIIEEAVKKVRAKREQTEEQHALAVKVKELRDGGMPWWRIGYELGLPGSADNVAQGKGGAGAARRLYAGAFGALPERPAPKTPRKPAEKNEAVKALKAAPKAERVEAVRTGSGALGADLTDAQVLDALRGRTLTWTINLADMDGGPNSYSEDSAQVHPKWAKIEHHGGERCIAFREMDMKAKAADARSNPGPTRVVRLSRIHNVR
jgi:hypothetical protein